MTTRPAQPTDAELIEPFTARDPIDLLAVAPVVLGFHPDDYVAMLTFDTRRNFHAGIALPTGCSRPDAALVADALLGPAQQHGVPRVVLLIYSADEIAAGRVWRSFRAGARAAGIDVVDSMRVADGRYHSYRDPDRRSREIGRPFDISGHPFLVRAVMQGQAILPSRADLVASAAPDPAAQRRVSAVLAARGRATGPDTCEEPIAHAAAAWVAGRVALHAGAGTRCDDVEVARLLREIQDPHVRNAAWILVTRENAGRHQGFWHDVVRRAPDSLVTEPAAMLAWCAWQAGNGALAWVAVDRCRAVDPGHSLAGLVADALERALPPEAGALAFDWLTDSGH